MHGNLGVWPSLIVGEMIVEKLNCALKAARAEHEATMQVLRKESDALEKRKMELFDKQDECLQEVDVELNDIKDAMRARVEDAARDRSKLEQALARAVIECDDAAKQNNAGKISFRTLKRVAKELGENMTDEELQDMIDQADAAQAINDEAATLPMAQSATASLVEVAGNESTAGEVEQVGKLSLEGGQTMLLSEQYPASSEPMAARTASGTLLSGSTPLSLARSPLPEQLAAQVEQLCPQQCDSQARLVCVSDESTHDSVASMSLQVLEPKSIGDACGASADDSKPPQSSVVHAGGQPEAGPGGDFCAPCSQSAVQPKSARRKPPVWRGPVMCWRCKQEGHMRKSRRCPAWGIKSDALQPKAQGAEVGKSREQHRTRKSREQHRTRKQQGAGGVSADPKANAQALSKAQSAKPAIPAVQSAKPVTTETVRGAVGQQGVGAQTKSVKSERPTGTSTSVLPGRTYARALIQGVTKVPAETVVPVETAQCAAVGVVQGLSETVVSEKKEELVAEPGQLGQANVQAMTKLEVQEVTPPKMPKHCTALPAEKQQRIASGRSRRPRFISRRRNRDVMQRCAADCAIQQQQLPMKTMQKMMTMETKMIEMMTKIESMVKTAEAQIECLMLLQQTGK